MGAAAEHEEARMERRLRILKNSRRGKKGSITKRIKMLEELLEENTGKRRLKFLTEALGAVSDELQKVCEEISALSDVDDLYDIEDIRFTVEDCLASVSDHLEARAEETVTGSSLTDTGLPVDTGEHDSSGTRVPDIGLNVDHGKSGSSGTRVPGTGLNMDHGEHEFSGTRVPDTGLNVDPVHDSSRSFHFPSNFLHDP